MDEQIKTFNTPKIFFLSFKICNLLFILHLQYINFEQINLLCIFHSKIIKSVLQWTLYEEIFS